MNVVRKFHITFKHQKQFKDQLNQMGCLIMNQHFLILHGHLNVFKDHLNSNLKRLNHFMVE